MTARFDLEAAISNAREAYDRAKTAERDAWRTLSELLDQKLDQKRASEPPKDPNALTLLQRLDALFPLSPYTIKAYLREGGLNARNWFRSASTEELEAFGYTNPWGRRQYHTCVFCGAMASTRSLTRRVVLRREMRQISAALLVLYDRMQTATGQDYEFLRRQYYQLSLSMNSRANEAALITIKAND